MLKSKKNEFAFEKKDSLLKKDISFEDISNVFNHIESTIYNDFCHTNEYADKLVSEKNYRAVSSVL
jgi:hypothetical protein